MTVTGGFHGEGIPVFREAQSVIGPLPVRHIGDRGVPADKLTRGVPGTETRQVQPARFSAAQYAQVHFQPDRAGDEVGLDGVDHPLAIVGVERELMEEVGAACENRLRRESSHLQQTG